MLATRQRPGTRVWWTRERVRAGLRDLRVATGEAPTDGIEFARLIRSREYTRARAAVRRYPGIKTIRRYYASLWDAWADAGVRIERTWQSWSDVEIWYLREAIGLYTFKEIAADLYRTVCAVDAMAAVLGLNPLRPRGLWPIRSIARAIGRSEKYTKRRIEESGIPIRLGWGSGGCHLRLVDPADLVEVRGIRWPAVSEELILATQRRLITQIVRLLETRTS